jgi:hypothetical protein
MLSALSLDLRERVSCGDCGWDVVSAKLVDQMFPTETPTLI